MRKIYSSQNTLMVDHLRLVVEGAGIDCVVKNRDLTGLAGRIPFGECFLELWIVNDHDFEAAKQIVDRAFTGTSETRVWKCLACGEEVDKGFDQCWQCGAVKGEREAPANFNQSPEIEMREPISKEALYWGAWIIMALVSIAMLKAYTG